MNARVGRLHVLTDETLQGRWSHLDLARAAAAGGADVVQYREKRARTFDQRLRVAAALAAALADTGTRLIVDDDERLARRCGAAGVHVGPDDPTPGDVRGANPAPFLIGATANDLASARRLIDDPVDYLGVGPVFATRSKAGPAPRLGLDGLARIVRAVSVPVVAIGGIDAARARAVLETGAWGVAVLGAVALADDPCAATRALREAVDAAAGQAVRG